MKKEMSYLYIFAFDISHSQSSSFARLIYPHPSIFYFPPPTPFNF